MIDLKDFTTADLVKELRTRTRIIDLCSEDEIIEEAESINYELKYSNSNFEDKAHDLAVELNDYKIVANLLYLEAIDFKPNIIKILDIIEDNFR